MKKWMILLGILVFLTILIGSKFLFNDAKPKVVVVLHELDTEFSKTIKAGIEKGFADFGIDGKVIAPDSTYSASKQIAMLKEVLKQNPDALIVTPIESSDTIPVLEEYKERNIPVLMLNRDARWKDKTTFIGTDHLRLGEIGGAMLSSFLYPGDKVVFIIDTETNSVVNDRIKGARKILESTEIKIVTEQLSYDTTVNMDSKISNILQTHPDMKGVFAINDTIAIDVLKVIEDKGITIPVIGTEGTKGMLKAVEEKKLSMTLAQNPYDMGYLSVEKALHSIRGEHIDERIDSGVDIVTTSNAKPRIDFLIKNVFN